MTKVIFLTNKEQLKRFGIFNGLEQLKNRGFLIFTCEKLVFANNLDNAEIVFVWDRNIGEDEVDNPYWWNDTFLPMKKEDEKWYVIHHTKGIQPKATDSIFPTQGKHIVGNPIYSNVCKILLDNDGDKKERIIKSVLFPIKLNDFLNICNNRKPNTEDFQILTDAGYPDKLSELEGEYSTSTYFESLKQLSDMLWNWAGIE